MRVRSIASVKVFLSLLVFSLSGALLLSSVLLGFSLFTVRSIASLKLFGQF